MAGAGFVTGLQGLSGGSGFCTCIAPAPDRGGFHHGEG